MFKSIKHIITQYDNKTQKYISNYHLVDDDFECDISVSSPTLTATIVFSAVSVVKEYYNRGLDIVKNTYLLNTYSQKEWEPSCTFMGILSWQNQYIDRYFPIDGISFSKDIYPKVKEMYETLSAFE